MQQSNVLLSLGILLNIGSSSSVVLFHQTVPDAGVVPCTGDRVELECITDTGTVVWKSDDGVTQLSEISETGNRGSFFFTVTADDGNMITSRATITSVNTSLNGSSIGCSGVFQLDSFIYLTINVTGPPVLPVANITVKPINDSALFINWTEQQQCINHYNITITSNETYTENNTVYTSKTTIPSLIIGTNYSFIIIPIDTIGREGPPSSLIQYIWNVPAQVVNISWYQISNDSITIWWNNTGDSTIPSPPIIHYIVNVTNTTDEQHTSNDTNAIITGLSPINEYYTVTIIPVNIIGYGPSTTVNVNVTSITPTMTSSSVVPTRVSSSVTLTTDISTSTSVIVISSTSIIVSSTNEQQSSSFISANNMSPRTTSTSTGTTSMSTPVSSTTVSTTASGSNTVPIISGAIGTVFVIIIIIIIILIIILVYAKRHRIKNKESHTANGNGNESRGVTGSSYRNNNIELQTTDPTYATPTTEYTPAAASTLRTLQGGDGPPSYPPPPPTGQYSVLRGSNDDDEVPPPVPAYNPNGVQEYSELRREGEKKNKRRQQQQQQGGGGAGPLYSTLNQDVPPPVPPAYNPEGVQEYSVLKREGENKNQQSLSATATGLYSTINKDTNPQLLVDESAHKPVYADLSIAGKGKRPQAAPTQEQPVVYASVNNKSVPPPVPPSVAPDKVLYADLSVAAGNRTPRNKPPTEERVVYAAVNGNRKSTTQELIMDRLGGLDIPPPIPPKPKP